VTYVHLYKAAGGWFSKKYPPPHVGEAGTLRIIKAVLQEPLTRDPYCNGNTAKTNHAIAPCGA
jgi:hypothetical protein